jgi:hypothetical protein
MAAQQDNASPWEETARPDPSGGGNPATRPDPSDLQDREDPQDGDGDGIGCTLPMEAEHPPSMGMAQARLVDTSPGAWRRRPTRPTIARPRRERRDPRGRFGVHRWEEEGAWGSYRMGRGTVDTAVEKMKATTAGMSRVPPPRALRVRWTGQLRASGWDGGPDARNMRDKIFAMAHRSTRALLFCKLKHITS